MIDGFATARSLTARLRARHKKKRPMTLVMGREQAAGTADAAAMLKRNNRLKRRRPL